MATVTVTTTAGADGSTTTTVSTSPNTSGVTVNDGAIGNWSSSITFALNGKTVTLDSADVHPRMTLLEYLREHTRLSGTKASCTQGGCGACNVMLTTFQDGKPSYASVNACIRPVLSLDGCAVTTSEGIGNKKKGFHPVQERIAACNGSQCGFCTPGHVMAMYSLLRDKASRPESGPLTLAEIEERFDGNICRCTGYRPILTAFHTFAQETSKDNHKIAGLDKFDFPSYDPAKEPIAPANIGRVAASPKPLRLKANDGTLWYRPVTLDQLSNVKKSHPKGKIICAHTSQGVYGFDSVSKVFIDISKIPEVASSGRAAASAVALSVPAATTVTQLIRVLETADSKSASFKEIVAHLKKVASWQVRNVGSITGNLMMARVNGFTSDIATVLMGANTTVKFVQISSGTTHSVGLYDFLHSQGIAGVNSDDLLVTTITIPFLGPDEHYRSYRQAKRSNNSHPLINAAFRMTVDGQTSEIKAASFAFGCVDKAAIFAKAAEAAVVGKKLGDPTTIAAAIDALEAVNVQPESHFVTIRDPTGMAAYRKGLLSSFMYKFFVAVDPNAPAILKSAGEAYERGVSSGSQAFETELPNDHPGKKPAPKFEAREQASGEVKYTDDVPAANPYYGAIAMCSFAPAVVTSVDVSAALAMPGVVDFISGSDIPGFNCSSPFGPGEEILFPVPYSPKEGATDEETAAAKKMATVLHYGQALGVVVAKSRREAEAAAKLVNATYSTEGLTPIYTIGEARAAGKADPPLINERGDVSAVFKQSGLKVVEGTLTIGGQSHFAMEKHSTLAVPDECGRLIVNTSTQAADLCRQFLAAVCAKSTIDVDIESRRLGGGFGSKFTKNVPVMAGAAVAALKLGAPVKIQNSIEVDMVAAGHCRHPFEVKYKAAVDPVTKKIAAVEWDVWQDKGCATDFSPFVGTEILSHSEVLYTIPAFKVTLTSVNTNTSSNTAVRGPGIPQAHAIGETVIEHLAVELGIDTEEFRKINLMGPDENTMAPGGGIPLKAVNYTMPRIWEELTKSSDIAARKEEIEKFNAGSKWVKRGIAMTPIRYSHMQGINGGTTCLVNIHGSDMTGPVVQVHHGGAEMGQGLNMKVRQIVSVTLGVPLESIHVHATKTAVTPNMSITGGSVGSETCVVAARKACLTLLERMKPVKEILEKEKKAKAEAEGKEPEAPTFAEICAKSVGGLMEGFKINLSATANYVPKEGRLPGDDGSEGENLPLPQGCYLTFGAAVSEVEVDILTGDVRTIRSDLLYDCGHSLNPLIDIGQAEGAFIFGQGLFLHEEIDTAPSGEVLTKGTWEYKPALSLNVPRDFRVTFLKDSPFEGGVKSSKAVGEPPLVAAYSMFNAVKNAIRASRVERGLSPHVQLNVPAQCQNVWTAAEVDLKASSA